jgi:rsbT co-antagonist protein RsbR
VTDTPDQPTSARRAASAEASHLLPELVAHLRENRTQLREEWARRITDARLLTAMTPEELFSEATSVYDNYVEVLETGSVEALQDYARSLSERIIPRGVETEEVLGIVLLLRDVLARSLFKKYQGDFDLLNRVLDAYEPAANRIANTVGVSFVQERERIIRQQQEAIRELSTPVLQVRERLVILPIIGILDSQRARQVTEQLLSGIRTHRAKVVVIDITGVPEIDSTVANHLGQPPGADRRGLAADGRQRDHHRPVVRDRPDPGHHRRRPVQDERGRRPPGWHRAGRAPARLRGDAHRRRRAGRRDPLTRVTTQPIPWRTSRSSANAGTSSRPSSRRCPTARPRGCRTS